MKYDLTDLRLFLAIAETQNMTHGAKRMHLAASSASHRIRQFEETLGTPLLERHARGVGLTRAGEVLLRHAREVLAQLEQMHADLAPYGDGIRGHLSLWANTHATHSYLPDDLAGFLRSHPQVSISLEEHNSPDIVMAVARGDVDIGVVAGRVDGVEVELIPYRADRLVLIVPAGHPLNAMTGVRFADVIDHPFVMLNAGSAIHTFTMNAAAALGRHLNVRIQVRSFEAVCRMVGSGVGLGLVPRSAVRTGELSEPPTIVELDESWAQRDLQICIRRRAALSGFAALLVETLQAKGAVPALA